MTPLSIISPLLFLSVAVVLLVFLILPSWVYEPALAEIDMISSDPSVSEYFYGQGQSTEGIEPLITFSASLVSLTIYSSLICVDVLTPCTITYQELPKHAIYAVIGQFAGVPRAVHDILDTMGHFRGLIQRCLIWTTTIMIVVVIATVSARSKVYVQVPTRETYSQLHQTMNDHQIQVYDDPNVIRFVMVLAGVAGLIQMIAVFVQFGLSGAEMYRCVSVLTDSIAHMPLVGKTRTIDTTALQSPLFSIDWTLLEGSYALIVAIFLITTASVILVIGGISLKDRRISYHSKLVAEPSPPRYTYQMLPKPTKASPEQSSVYESAENLHPSTYTKRNDIGGKSPSPIGGRMNPIASSRNDKVGPAAKKVSPRKALMSTPKKTVNT